MTLSRIDLFISFFKIGAIGFGGPVALVAMMEAEFVTKRKLISVSDFQQKYVLCKMLPGPVAYQMALSIGRQLKGRWGGLASGLGFLVPGVILILLLSIFYRNLKEASYYQELSQGLQLGAFFIIVESTFRLAKPEWHSVKNCIMIVTAFILMLLFPKIEPLIIISMGVIALALIVSKTPKIKSDLILLQLFWVHFKAAWIVFGTGLAVIPVLQQDIVFTHQWLENSVFLDGITFGQITPGPVTITSVFVGYQIASFAGAFFAMLGMYLPGAIIILGFMPYFEDRIFKSEKAKHFKQGAVCAVIGCIAASVFILFGSLLVVPKNLVLICIFTLLYWRFKLPPVLMIPLGGFATLVLKHIF